MTEPWFIPFDILMILCTITGTIFCLTCLCIIIIDKACHTVPLMLIANTYLVGFFFGLNVFFMSVSTIINDLKQIEYQDLFCIVRGYVGYVTCAALNYSFLLQAIYRYIIVVYPTRLLFRSSKFHGLLIIITWIFSFFYSLPFLFNNRIIHIIDNQICQLPLQRSFVIIYMSSCIYTIPILLVMFTYIRLVRYVRRMSKRVISADAYSRAKKELQMVRRLVVIVTLLTVICFPYEVFIIMSFFTVPPKYHFRIAYIFVDSAYTLVMIILFQFTEALQRFITRKLRRERNVVGVARIA